MPATTRIDYKRELRELYAPPRKPVIVEVPELSYLMIDGHGDPTTAPRFGEAVEALYSVAYGAKFAVRHGAGIDYVVMPLEGLFWAPEVRVLADADKSSWDWTLMIMQPDCVTREIAEEARAAAEAKKPLEAIARMRAGSLAEGRVAQLMHIGPYAAEGPTIEQLHAFIAEQGCRPSGKHHEVYLSDPRRAAPEKMRTVLRQPIVEAG